MGNPLYKKIETNITISDDDRVLINEILTKIFIDRPDTAIFFYMFVKKFGEKVIDDGFLIKIKFGKELDELVDQAVKRYKEEKIKMLNIEKDKI